MTNQPHSTDLQLSGGSAATTETSHFNRLTPAEAERLAWLAEECGEVTQMIGKILRHGYDSCHPNDQHQVTNRELLEGELGDISAAMDLMQTARDVNSSTILAAALEKRRRVRCYLHHQPEDVVNGG